MLLITINWFQRPSSIRQFCLSSPTTNYYYLFESGKLSKLYIWLYMTIIVWHCFIFCIQLFATIFYCITFYCILFNTSNTLVTVLLDSFNPDIAQWSRLLPHQHATAMPRDGRRIKIFEFQFSFHPSRRILPRSTAQCSLQPFPRAHAGKWVAFNYRSHKLLVVNHSR